MLNKKAQSLTEIALIIGIVGLVFVAMEAYIKRGVQGKIKDLTDNMITSNQSLYTEDMTGVSVYNYTTNTIYGGQMQTAEGPGARSVNTNESIAANSVSTSNFSSTSAAASGTPGAVTVPTSTPTQ